jgi:hypothetical protein
LSKVPRAHNISAFKVPALSIFLRSRRLCFRRPCAQRFSSLSTSPLSTSLFNSIMGRKTDNILKWSLPELQNTAQVLRIETPSDSRHELLVDIFLSRNGTDRLQCPRTSEGIRGLIFQSYEDVARATNWNKGAVPKYVLIEKYANVML